jgi:hypothetical protein
MAKRSPTPGGPQQHAVQSLGTNITVRLAERDTVIFDVKAPTATSSFSIDYSTAQRLGLQLVELVASARGKSSDLLFEESPPGVPMIHHEFEFVVAKDGQQVQFLIHIEAWKPLIMTLDPAEIDELIEKLADVRRQLTMQNE